MKIYPSKHRVYFRKQATPEMIPLSYAYNDENNRDITIRIEDTFGYPYTKYQVQPYQIFDSDDIFLFDKTDTPLPNAAKYLQRNGAKWRLLPEKVTEFVPKTFDFSVTVQRDALYSKEGKYGINLGFAFPNTTIPDQLFNLVSNTAQAKPYPANIIFNRGESVKNAFLNLSESECNILFMSFTVLETRAAENQRTVQEEVDNILRKHINLWIVDDTFGGSFFETGSDESYGRYRLAYNDIYAVDDGLLSYYKANDKFIRIRTGRKWQGAGDGKEIPFFTEGSPLQIIHRTGLGYVIVSHTSFLSKMNTAEDDKAQARLFFETVLYVYLHGYHTLTKSQVFITDEPIDYFINTSQRYMLSHTRMNLDRLLQQSGYNIQIPYSIVAVTTEIPEKETGNYTVQYAGTNRFNDLVFKKIAEQTKDPAKGNNLLIYTVDKTMLICKPENMNIFVIESGVQLRLIDEYTIAVMPVHSTQQRICTTREETVALEKLGNYFLCYDRDSYYDHAVAPFRLLPEEEYQNASELHDLVIIATVSIAVNMDIDYKDIRILGGGEASTIPNYEMIDTGNLYGRPYRYGGPMIIELPYRFKLMKDEIRSEVNKHIASGDYPIILYKD